MWYLVYLCYRLIISLGAHQVTYRYPRFMRWHHDCWPPIDWLDLKAEHRSNKMIRPWFDFHVRRMQRVLLRATIILCFLLVWRWRTRTIFEYTARRAEEKINNECRIGVECKGVADAMSRGVAFLFFFGLTQMQHYMALCWLLTF